MSKPFLTTYSVSDGLLLAQLMHKTYTVKSKRIKTIYFFKHDSPFLGQSKFCDIYSYNLFLGVFMALDLCPRVRQVLQLLFFFPFLFLFFTTNQQDVAQLDTSQQFGRFKYNTATVTNYPKLLLWIPITKHCYPLLFPHLILLEVWQEWGCESSCCIFSSHCVWKSINVCLVEGHVSKEMRWSQRERERESEGVRQTVRKRAFPPVSPC